MNWCVLLMRSRWLGLGRLGRLGLGIPRARPLLVGGGRHEVLPEVRLEVGLELRLKLRRLLLLLGPLELDPCLAQESELESIEGAGFLILGLEVEVLEASLFLGELGLRAATVPRAPGFVGFTLSHSRVRVSDEEAEGFWCVELILGMKVRDAHFSCSHFVLFEESLVVRVLSHSTV
jgi:hypothetical protein